jgi:hypothetical protein
VERGSSRGFCDFLILLTIHFGAHMVAAQDTFSQIAGSLLDATGSPLEGLSVVADGPSGVRSTLSNDAGAFTIASLLPGRYVLEIANEQTTLAKLDPIELTTGRTLAIRITLPAPHAEETTVTASVDRRRLASDYSETLTSREIARLPHGRDLLSALTLLPGAALEPEAGGVQVAGASGSEHRWFVDALDTTSPQKGTPTIELPADLVEEIQLRRSGYQAEFGGAVGGVVSVVTRSGGDRLAGSVAIRSEHSSLRGEPRPSLELSAAGDDAVLVRYEKDTAHRIDPSLAVGGPLAGNRVRFFAGIEGGSETVSREVDFLDGGRGTFSLDRRWRTVTANAASAITDSVWVRVSAIQSPSSSRGGLPEASGRGSSNPADYRGSERRDNDAISALVEALPAGDWSIGLRMGRQRTDYATGGASSSPFAKSFQVNSPSIFPEVPSELVRPVGFSNSPSFTLWRRDEYSRSSGALEVTRAIQARGQHQVKAGVQVERIENSVLRDQSATSMEFQWGAGDAIFGELGRGRYGSLAVYRYQTAGDVRSDNMALFVQDAWRPVPSLTVELGFRWEREQVPDYRLGHEGESAIEFDFGDKQAPRFGIIWSPVDSPRWTLFGSYGRYFDVTKYELARVSFGSERRVRYVYALDGFDWPNINCSVRVNDPASPPDCGPQARFVAAVNLRNPSNDAIDPALRPGESEQWQVGLERPIGIGTRIALRYERNELLRAIEDIGAFVPGVGEVFVIGNPGEGRSRLASGTTPLPRPKRTYQAAELTVDSRGRRAFWRASYTYSRLRGNFPGLASSDESGRASPNVLRAYDAWFTAFDQTGRPVEGPLGTDRPHRFQAHGAIELGRGWSAAIAQYAASGTPRTTRAARNQVYFFPYGRGDLGRNPTLTQTDLRLAHRWALSRSELELNLTVLNLFDEDTVLEINEELHAGSLSLSDEEFLAGFDVREVMARQGLGVRPTYGKPSAFHAPRTTLLSATLRF